MVLKGVKRMTLCLMWKKLPHKIQLGLKLSIHTRFRWMHEPFARGDENTTLWSSSKQTKVSLVMRENQISPNLVHYTKYWPLLKAQRSPQIRKSWRHCPSPGEPGRRDDSVGHVNVHGILERKGTACKNLKKYG